MWSQAADSQDEFEMNMRLIGAPTLKDVVPGMVDTSALNPGQAPDTQFDANCTFTFNAPSQADEVDERMVPIGVKAKL